MGVVVIPRVIFGLMAPAFASASPDALMPLPSREAAAPFGQRQSRSLPHTLPGVWFVPFGTVPAAAGQATPCPAGHSAFSGRCHLFEAAACAAGYRARFHWLGCPRSFDSLAPGSACPFGSRHCGIYPGLSQGPVLPSPSPNSLRQFHQTNHGNGIIPNG